LSQVFTLGEEVNWQTAEDHAPDVIRRLCQLGWPSEVLMSLNFPKIPSADVKGVCVAPQGHHKLGDQLVECIDPRGRPYIWVGPLLANDGLVAGSDMECAETGHVIVTPLTINLTHQDTLERLIDVFHA